MALSADMLFDSLYTKNPAGSLYLPVYGVDGTPADGDVPIWDDTNKKLAFGAAGGGGALASLSDVSLSSPAAGDGFQFNGTVWVNSASLDANARVGVRKNSGGSTYKRRRVNLIEGANVTLTVADDSGGEEVDVTIDAVAGGGSSGGTFSYYDPDKPESSPSSSDDEFDGASLSGSWTQVNWQSGGANMSYDQDTTVPGALFVSYTASGSNTTRALLKSIPAGDFTIQTDVITGDVPNSYIYTGLILTDGTTAGAGNQFFVGFVCDGSNSQPYHRCYVQTWQNFNDVGITTRGGPNTWGQDGGIVNIFRSGTTYTCRFSPDGRTGRTSGALTIGFTPTHMGIMIKNNTSVSGAARFRHFRYKGSANYNFGGVRTVVGS